MTLDIVNDGAVSTGNVYIQPQKTGVLYNAYLVKPIFENVNIETLLFFASTTEKSIKLKFGYENKAGWEKVKKEKIQLPLTAVGEIDFVFMENFIAELEARRIAELEAYLSTTGLNDSILTAEDSAAVQGFEKVQWGEFTFATVFDNIKQGRRLKKEDQIEGDIPFVMAGTTNTGVVNYISNPIASFPKNSITIDIFGNTFYRNCDFGAGDDTGIYWNSKTNYTKEQMLYFATSMSKSLDGKFSFGKKLRSSQSFDFKMYLPIAAGKIDYSFMATFISAIQKLVIADVVRYTDKKIAATQVAAGFEEKELF
jgi:hypothetical protein